MSTSGPPPAHEVAAAKRGNSGIYDVHDDLVSFRHFAHNLQPTPRNGEEFLQRFKSNFEINILERPGPNHLVLELIGCDVSFMNALRRIMLSEVPTVAIEHVYMWNNSSLVQDEVLAHRLGLVPLQVDPRLFDDFVEGEDEPTDRNTVVFRLAVQCKKPKTTSGGAKTEEAAQDGNDSKSKKKGPNFAGDGDIADTTDSVLQNAEMDQTARDAYYRGTTSTSNVMMSARAQEATTPDKIAQAIDTPGRPYTQHVYSRHLEWVPQGDQAQRFADNPICPVEPDILLAKLRHGQVLELEAHGRRGVGKDHAKYSPVATASYRLLPHVQILEPVLDEDADELAHYYEPGVFRVVPLTPEERQAHPGKTRKAVVHNPYACTMSRNFMRNERLKRAIKMTRISDHFVLSIESVGMMKPAVIFAQALRILQDKCRNVSGLAEEYASKLQSVGGTASAAAGKEDNPTATEKGQEDKDDPMDQDDE